MDSPRPEVKESRQGMEAYTGFQTSLEGKLTFQGVLRLNGRFSGTIESKEGTLIVGKEATIDANILVHIAVVSGEVRGNIQATHRVELHPTARVFGDLIAPVMTVDAGARLNGNFTVWPKDHPGSRPINSQPPPFIAPT